jgi:CBS domain containing-hemolysin-like protein
VVDEYGGVAGLVTVEDVAEELLGSISEEPERPGVEHVAPGQWAIKGSLPVEDVTRLGVPVPDGDWNTVAGMMMGLAGRIMKRGDHIDLGDYRFEVLSAHGRRITRVEIRLLPDLTAAPDNEDHH